ncbi:ATP-dependent helicase HrpB [Erythrobacter sp. MTPC3]|uniref:ATP-dependent helicase HrpB n=1 Tax=Erythrobacter sp. MTPC3 TaxID=3056564 RepID=UPI0036F3CFD9
MSDRLPISDVLPEIRTALSESGAGVLIAPPGAGKTTAVAPALLEESWCDGTIIITSPRRVAARAAAERMAQMLGEKPGQTAGYMTRLDSKVSSATRILVVTEAILVNRLVDDPELPGVSAVLFDEAHERHLDSDLGLTLALETRSVLREDLRVLVMSATIDGTRFARLLGEDAAVIESEGRSYPLELRWLGSDGTASVEDQVARGIMTAWKEQEGDILAFLPGMREIERARERLEPKLPETPILALHGQVDPASQREAIRKDPGGRRRIVLATAIAETSLTLDGVSVVVDSGLARYAEHDRAAGTTHLVTRRASQAAATQRAGRAARQGPGIAYRLWEEGGHGGRPAFSPPEIDIADLAPLVLKLAKWGAVNPSDMPWLDAPPAASIAAAHASLTALGALDDTGRITAWGDDIASMPMSPDQAAAVLHGALAGCAEEAARLIMLVQERGLGGRSEDLAQRLNGWKNDRSRRAQSAAQIAAGWARAAAKADLGTKSAAHDAAECLAIARPDFVARRRDKSGEQWITAGGRGFQLDPASPLASAEWIVIADAQGQAKGARITAGIEIPARRIEIIFADRVEERSILSWNTDADRAEARWERRLGAITLSRGPDPQPDADAMAAFLVDKALDRLGELFPAGFLARAQFTGVDALGEGALREDADLWLTPLLTGRRDLSVSPQRFADAALARLDWNTRQKFEAEAPTHFASPAGTRHPIDYAGDDAPSVEVRVQALFGLDTQPMIGRVPLLLKLTSPAGRPIQSTRDLPGFWRGSWADVAKDMKGRYPKHRWPDQPWTEKPSLKTKNAFNRS